VAYYYCTLLEILDFLTLRNRRRHSEATFLINILLALNLAPLSSIELGFVFLLGTFLTSACSLANIANGFQLFVSQPQCSLYGYKYIVTHCQAMAQ
jgi:hypothetical protein